MPRRNLAGGWDGESTRLTVRFSRQDLRALADLADVWGIDKSEAIRRAVREAAKNAHRQQQAEVLAALPTMTVPELRDVAAGLSIAARSKMPKPELLAVLRHRLQPASSK